MRRLKLISLCLLLAACGQRVKPQHTEPVTVKVFTVVPVSEESSLHYVGRVVSGGTATVASPYPGKLVRLPVRSGQSVTQGTLLAEVRSEAVISAHKAAQASLSRAEDGHQRMMKLYAGGGVAEVKKVEVESQLEQARAAATAARQAVEDGYLRAPFSGVVEEVLAVKGVDVSALTPILRLVDTDGLEVRFPVPENEISSLKVGEKVFIEVPAAEALIEAPLSAKGMVASPLSHTYDCIVRIRDASVLPGMVCKVRLPRESGTAFIVPASALRTGAEGRYVWCVEDGTVVRRNVVTDGYSGEGVVITEGLFQGDQVVVEGGRKVSSGMKVHTVWN